MPHIKWQLFKVWDSNRHLQKEWDCPDRWNNFFCYFAKLYSPTSMKQTIALTSVVHKSLLVFWKCLCCFCFLPSHLSAVIRSVPQASSQLFFRVLHFWHLWIHFPVFIIATRSVQILSLEGLHLEKKKWMKWMAVRKPNCNSNVSLHSQPDFSWHS